MNSRPIVSEAKSLIKPDQEIGYGSLVESINMDVRNNSQVEGTSAELQQPSPSPPLQQPENNTNSNGDEKYQERLDEEKKLRRLLRFYRYAPLKIKDGKLHIHVLYCLIMAIQITKIGLNTTQMLEFANYRAKFSSAVNREHLTLRHLLLNNWDSSLETLPYPPAHGDFAVYKTDSLLQDLNYAVEGYYNARNHAIGFFFLSNRSGTIDKMLGRMKYFDFTGFHPNSNYQGITVKEIEFPVGDTGLTRHVDPVTNETTYMYNITETFKDLNLTEPFKRLLSIHLDFSLHAVRVYEKATALICLQINGIVKFEDTDNNGQMLVDLETSTKWISCSQIFRNDSVQDVDLSTEYKQYRLYVTIFCGISLLIGGRFLVFGLRIIWKTSRYMKGHFEEFYQVDSTDETIKDLTCREYIKLSAILLWDVIVIASDGCTIAGSWNKAFHSSTEHKNQQLSDFDTAAVCLGIGGLLSWFYIFKLSKLHSNFQVLLNTLYYSFGTMLTYLISITVLFVAFFLCGFVVLGPYHIKFETASATAETLFSIVNGDEIFATLANVEYNKTGSNKSQWWVFPSFICLYVALFTIVVLNLLVAIFVNAYDAVKENQKHEENLRVSALEKALNNFFNESEKSSGSRLLSACYDLIQDDNSISDEESQVQTELRKLWRMKSDDGSIKLVKLKERTLRAFIDEGNDGSKGVCCCNKLVFYLKPSHFD